MFLLQRAPIDVHTSVGCLRAPELLEHTTTSLMDASITRFPYAAAIIRQAIDESEVEAITTLETRDAAVRIASFLQPVNKALRAWWGKHSPDSNLTVKDLEYRQLTSAPWAGYHFDQVIFSRWGDTGHGPITALLMAQGEVEYNFSVLRKDVLSEEGQTFWKGTLGKPMKEPRVTKTLTARTGDLVLFTNTPPTGHSAKRLSKERLTSVYHSRFEIVKPVE